MNKIIIVIVAIFILQGCKIECDIDCFITAANNCETISQEQSTEAGTFGYSAENCVLTKNVINLDESESQEMKDLLIGKSMACSYEQGNFDEGWFTLVDGIEKCEGELKEIISQLMLFA